MSRVTSRAACRGTRTRGVVEVVDDEQRDKPRDEPYDVSRHLDARRKRSSRRQAARRAVTPGRAARGADAPGRAT
jgi:hypothetical protein